MCGSPFAKCSDVQLVDGTAEIFGSEMTKMQAYNLTGQKVAVRCLVIFEAQPAACHPCISCIHAHQTRKMDSTLQTSAREVIQHICIYQNEWVEV
jgi:N-terminal beta-sandwich domain of polyadenylation factor